MTREEAYKRTKGYLYDGLSGEEVDEIIKALEQESVLDKIRAEINTMGGDIETIVDALAIIDKYRESEEDT